MAMILGLDQPATPTSDEREYLNRTRTWLACFCVDMSHAVQYGKVPLLRVRDYLARSSRDWYKSSPYNMSCDVYLCAFVELLLVMGEFQIAVGGEDLDQKVRNGFDISSIVNAFEDKLGCIAHEWNTRFSSLSRHRPAGKFVHDLSGLFRSLANRNRDNKLLSRHPSIVRFLRH